MIYKSQAHNLQARFIWTPETIHAADWTYAVITPFCPTDEDTVAIFEADGFNPGTNATRFDIGFARQWLDQLVEDGAAKDALWVYCIFDCSKDLRTNMSRVVPVHGNPTPLLELIGIVDYAYPDLKTTGWKKGGPLC